MPKLDIKFAWPVAVAGYRVVEPAEGAPYLVARGDEKRWRNPFAENPALFRRFALLPETPAGCIEFANENGLLFGVGYQRIGPDFDHDPNRAPTQYFEEVDLDRLSAWISQVRRVRRLIEDWDRARATGANTAPFWENLRTPRLGVQLVSRAGKPGLFLEPDCLLSAIDLQFYQAVAGMTELRACEQCGAWFECGPGGGRRTVSRFCSDRCRFNFHNERRSKGGQP